MDTAVVSGYLSGQGLWNIRASWNEPKQYKTGFFTYLMLNVLCESGHNTAQVGVAVEHCGMVT
jgi:hypothetical protein